MLHLLHIFKTFLLFVIPTMLQKIKQNIIN